MSKLMRQVREFAETQGFTLNQDVRVKEEYEGAEHLVELLLLQVEKKLEDVRRDLTEVVGCDLRIDRVHLIVEELGELVHGLAMRDVVETADGVADLAYVVTGTAAAFGLPLDALCDEVHASNMSKDVGGHKPAKGERYFKPDIRRVLESAMVLRTQR
tara:strand:+ start:1581 stop:2054 length:474 start_codon:yes stop_codon:yes gene_type:complete